MADKNPCYFGSNGTLKCENIYLMKQRQFKETRDKKGFAGKCHNRVIHNLVSISPQILGIKLKVVVFGVTVVTEYFPVMPSHFPLT